MKPGSMMNLVRARVRVRVRVRLGVTYRVGVGFGVGLGVWLGLVPWLGCIRVDVRVRRLKGSITRQEMAVLVHQPSSMMSVSLRP